MLDYVKLGYIKLLKYSLIVFITVAWSHTWWQYVILGLLFVSATLEWLLLAETMFAVFVQSLIICGLMFTSKPMVYWFIAFMVISEILGMLRLMELEEALADRKEPSNTKVDDKGALIAEQQLR